MPNPRLIDNGDGTVIDNLTGLVWLKNANCFGLQTWSQSLLLALAMSDSDCGLADGSQAGDWRIPNIKELMSIVEYGKFDGQFATPQLPSGHPFSNVKVDGNTYWSSTSVTSFVDWTSAVTVDMRKGIAPLGGKVQSKYAWPVRDQ